MADQTNGESTSKYDVLLEEVKDYAMMRYSLLKLELLEKLSRIIAFLVLGFVVLLMVLAAFIFFAISFSSWLTMVLDSQMWALIIVGAVFILIITLLFVLRKPLLINPIIRELSTILFDEQQFEQENEPNRP